MAHGRGCLLGTIRAIWLRSLCGCRIHVVMIVQSWGKVARQLVIFRAFGGLGLAFMQQCPGHVTSRGAQKYEQIATSIQVTYNLIQIL